MPTLPSGTPTNVAVKNAENDPLTDAFGNCKDKHLRRGISRYQHRSRFYLHNDSGRKVPLRCGRLWAALLIVHCYAVYTTLTQGIKINVEFSAFEITIDG